MYRRLVINESCVPPPVQPELTNAAVHQCFTLASVQCSVETVGALLMLSHWVGGWGNHCWSVGGQCSLPSLVFVILEQQCSGEMVSNQFNVKCRNKSFRQNGFISNIISLEWPPFQIGDPFLPLLLLDMDMVDMVDMVA